MDIVNEYTASDTFRMNSEASGIRDTGAMIATVDDVIQTIALPTSSFVTVRSVATSTSDKKPLSKGKIVYKIQSMRIAFLKEPI